MSKPKIISFNQTIAKSLKIIKKKFVYIFLSSLPFIVVSSLNSYRAIQKPSLSTKNADLTNTLLQSLSQELKYLIPILILSFATHLVTIMIVRDRRKSINIFKLYLESIFKLLPILGASLIISFMLIGGQWLLLVPAILFSVWFAFHQEAIIYASQGPITALSHSKSVIKGHFETALLYLIGFRLILVIPSIVLVIFQIKYSHLLPKFTYTFISIIVIQALAWIAVTSKALFYENLIKINKPIKPAPLKKYFIVSLLGWIIFISLAFFGAKFVSKIINQTQQKQLAAIEMRQRIENAQTITIADQTSTPIPTQSPKKLTLTSPQNRPAMTKDFIMTFNMLSVYKQDHGQYPNSLNELANNYFPDQNPINSATNQPFSYSPFKSGNKNVGYVLCPSSDSPKTDCFTWEYR